MEQYISKSAVLAEIERLREVQPFGAFQPKEQNKTDWLAGKLFTITILETFIDTLEVKDPYEKCIQYASIEDGIQAHAEIYSFNIESELFNQLTKEQQALWRKEIEQAYISGGEVGVELARDTRYKENIEVKEVDLEKEIEKSLKRHSMLAVGKKDFTDIAKHFFELGLKAQHKSISIQNIDNVLKELDVDPYSMEAKMIKESYFMAIEKLTQKGEEV